MCSVWIGFNLSSKLHGKGNYYIEYIEIVIIKVFGYFTLRIFNGFSGEISKQSVLLECWGVGEL